MIRAHLATFPPRRRLLRKTCEAILPQVDAFLACHSLGSLEDLAQALARPEEAGARDRLMRMREG